VTDGSRERAREALEALAAGRAPRLPSTLVSRERLHVALDRGVRSPLMMLVAPVGTGKTVLLSDWAARRRAAGGDVLWVPGHETDALEEFLTQLTAGDGSPYPDPVVVDDAHLLPAGTFSALSRVLTEAPQSVRLLMASRYDLPVPARELELRGLASTLRLRELRFTDAEAANLVHAHAAGASAEDVVLLQQKTAGWAAALVLAARTLATAGEDGAVMVTEQQFLDLLLGETFDSLDERVQSMLLSTYGAATITANLAVAFSGDPDAGAMLADLSGNGLLVTAHTEDHDNEPFYRYHPLLVEMLGRRALSNSADAELALAAHHRAALYYEIRGAGSAALRSAVQAHDPALLTRVLLGHGPAALAAGHVDLVAAAFEALPGGYVDADPHLLGVRGLLRRLAGDVTGAVMDAASAADAAAAATTTAPDDDALEADAVVLQLWESRYGWYDLDEAITRARSVLERVRTAVAGRDRIVLSPERMSWLLIELAAAETWANRLDSALRHLDEALVTARMAEHRQLIAGSLAHRAVVQYAQGQVQNAARSAQAALDATHGEPLADDYVARAQVVLGLAALNQLDLDRAQRWHQAVAASGAAGSDSVIAVLRATLRVHLLIEDGRLDDALTELATDPATPGPPPSFLTRDLAALRFRAAVLVGHQGESEAQIDMLEQTGNQAEATVLRAMSSITRGDVQATLAALDAALTQPGLHPVLATTAASFRTVLLLRAGDRPAAEAALLDTVNSAAPQRLLYALIPNGCEPAFLQLLRAHVDGPDPQPFAKIVLHRLSNYQARWSEAGGVSLLSQTRPDGDAPAPRRLEAVVNGVQIRLTSREADVLDQLALGSSYSDIAQALFITENTVKKHLMSLYRKLGVEKRSAALRVARDADLM
jgi:ATP/maltotriose-dependent transcriptional regulator MalT